MRPVIIFLLLNAVGAAQTTMINTTLRSSVNLPTPEWAAGNWGYEDANGRYLIQTKGSGGLAVVNVTDTANPFVASSVPGVSSGGISVKEVKVWNTYAYASTDSGPTRVIDLTNPAAVTVVASIPEGAHTLQIQGSHLYLNRAVQGKLEIRDLAANPLNPPLLGQYPPGAATTGLHDCAVEGNIVYLFGGPSDTKILDVTNPANIVLLGSIPSAQYNHSGDLYVTPSGQKVLLQLDEDIGAHVKIYDVTTPASPVLLSQYITSAAISVHNCLVKGGYAFISYYKDGLRVLDLSNPASPVEVGVFDPNPTNVPGGTYSGSWDVYPYHDAVYVGEMYDTVGSATQGAWIVDFFPAFGMGSPGTGGQVPEQWWSFGPPYQGNTRFALRLTNAAPNTAGYLVYGTSNTTWAGGPLPLDLVTLGLPGSTLYVSVDGLIPVTTDSQGNASVFLPVPVGLSGTFYTQFAVLDPSAQSGLAVTKAGKLFVP